jgi:FlaA1/EpsC-like NDP-sugar epimerase
MLKQEDDRRYAALILRRPEHLIESRHASACVLITGAAGYIGSALYRHFTPNVVGLDNSESAVAEMAGDGGRVELADIRDASSLHAAFTRYKPVVVIHAAAYKHVPLLERFPFEAFTTNAIGTKLVADAAEAHGVERFVLLSTDKAADPVSMLGLSKRVAELIVLSRTQSKTKFSAIRFGNVFGSTGSVVPIFAGQIAAGGPVTVTDPAASRFFITSAEAVGAVSAIATAEHPSGLFAYAPAPRLAIAELAARMIHAAGRNGDVRISFEGLRAGEKIRETLHGERERLAASVVDGLLRIESPIPRQDEVEIAIGEIVSACRERDHELLMSTVRGLVPEYPTSV